MALERRFGQHRSTDQSREQLDKHNCQEGESLGTFAADVQLHAQRGYPEFPLAAQEELSLHALPQSGCANMSALPCLCPSVRPSMRVNGPNWRSPHNLTNQESSLTALT